MLLTLPIILSGIIFKFTYYSQNYSQKVALLTKNPCKLANKSHKIIYEYKFNTLTKWEKLSIAKYFLSYSHEYEKYLIVDLSLYKCKCVIAWEMKQQPQF